MNNTQIKDALNAIKSVRAENKDCNYCPLWNTENSMCSYIYHRVSQDCEFAEVERNHCIFKK